MMDIRIARELGQELAGFVETGEIDRAHAILSPVLNQRTQFRYLDVIGKLTGLGPLESTGEFLAGIAAGGTEGGWVIIGSVLQSWFDRDLNAAFDRCRASIITADVWFGADILGERVPGPALLSQYDPALELLQGWRQDPNRWVRRAVGVAVHFWAKRTAGSEAHIDKAGRLLDLLAPMFEEREMDAVKGIGWGLKTMGRYYPELVVAWLQQQAGRNHRAIMVRKATTYLTPEQRFRARGDRNNVFLD